MALHDQLTWSSSYAQESTLAARPASRPARPASRPNFATSVPTDTFFHVLGAPAPHVYCAIMSRTLAQSDTKTSNRALFCEVRREFLVSQCLVMQSHLLVHQTAQMIHVMQQCNAGDTLLSRYMTTDMVRCVVILVGIRLTHRP